MLSNKGSMSKYNVASVMKELKFFLIIFHLNLNNHTQLLPYRTEQI